MYKNILAEMARNGLTREEVAKKLGLALPTFRKKMKGEVDFKQSEIDSLLSLFGEKVTYEYLFTN